MSPRWRRRAALALLLATVILAPVSAFTWAREEPPTVLWLSWGAILLTCADIAATTDVRVQEGGKENGPQSGDQGP